MQTVWNWLNGNKTIFGLVILQIATAIPSDTSIAGIPIVPILQWVGGTLTGAGVIHKIVKSDTTPTPSA